MKLKNLIGKKAIRNKPIKTISNYQVNDYSFTETPAKILKVDDNYVVIKTKNNKPLALLSETWDDGNWENYEKIKGVEL